MSNEEQNGNFAKPMLPAVFHSVEDKNITLTPLNLIDNFGVFDLDPCGLQWHKTANKIISLPDDGLIENWKGRVWPDTAIACSSGYGQAICTTFFEILEIR